MTKYDVLTIGNAIVDVIARTDDAFLSEHGIQKGSMTLIDAVRATSLYNAMGQRSRCQAVARPTLSLGS